MSLDRGSSIGLIGTYAGWVYSKRDTFGWLYSKRDTFLDGFTVTLDAMTKSVPLDNYVGCSAPIIGLILSVKVEPDNIS